MNGLISDYKHKGVVRMTFIEIPLSIKMNEFFWGFIFPVNLAEHLQQLTKKRFDQAVEDKCAKFYVSLYYDAFDVVQAVGYCTDSAEKFGGGRQFYVDLGVPEEFLKNSLDYGLSVMKRFGALKNHYMKGSKIVQYKEDEHLPTDETYRYFHMNVDGGIDTKWMWYLANGDFIYYSGEGARKVAERIGHKNIRHISLLDMSVSFLEKTE